MNINRDNYENFFLLYVDNELCAADRKTVEDFAAANPDLQEELAQLQDVVMMDETILFDDKISLLRPENMEEKLLLFLDNELDKSETEAFKQTLSASEMLRTELAILQQTKLDAADTIVFEDKQSLYRKEKDNVIAGRFIRWAAAAVLIGAGTFTVINLSNKKAGPDTELASGKKSSGRKESGTPVIKNQSVAPGNNINNSTIVLPDTDPVMAQTATDDMKKRSAQQTITADHPKKDELVKNNDQSNKDQEVLPATNPIQPNDDMVLLASNQKIEKINPEKSNNQMVINVPQNVIIDQNIMDIPTNSLASNASVSEETNDNRILYLNEDDVNRSKAAGFFRKLKRTVERKTKIKGGNGLKIAGFEIALK